MSDLIIVSMHEKGFPQADIYFGLGDTDPCEFAFMGLAPDGFFTMSVGDTLEAAFAKASAKYPNAKVVCAEDDEDDE